MYQGDDSSVFLKHAPCPSCGSKDNLAIYSDHSFCFGCGHYEGEGKPKTAKTAMTNLLQCEYQPLNKRGLNEETCRKWGYGTATMNGSPVQVANFRDANGTVVAQKVRFPQKNFTILGDSRAVPRLLYGAHLWGPGQKMIVVTEGELDALSVSQLQSLKWPVVSVPNGASGAAKAVAENAEYLESFEKVVFMFDMDDPGQQAARDCADLLSPGKASLAALPLKDANEMLVAGRGSEVIDAIWRARPHRPDGLVYGEDLWDKLNESREMGGHPYPWAGLNEKLHAIHPRTMVVLTSGTGVGKSSICRELAYHLLMLGEKVGYIALEESVDRSALGLIGVHLNKPVHLHHVRETVTDEELKQGFDATLGTGKVVFYDHFGSMENDRLIAKIRQMAACGVTTVFLDHLSIVVSALEGGDERRRIDSACTKLRQLVEEKGITLFLVSHLKRGEGRALEEGGQTSLSLLRGSSAIGQLADAVVGLERDQQGDNPNMTTVRVLKNRYSGDTGIAGFLKYSKDTGRLIEADFIPETEEETIEF